MSCVGLDGRLLSPNASSFFSSFYRATLCVSAVFSVGWCLSVCLSVCLSRSCIVSTWLKIS